MRLTAGQAHTAESLHDLLLNGLLLTGGGDINPKHYGQTPEIETHQPDDARDEMELGLLQQALSLDLPVLAICRGMQLLNVRLGGTLVQHLPSSDLHVKRLPDETPGHHRDAHQIDVAEGTRLAHIIGAGKHAVNSRHHQAIDSPGAGAVVSAKSEDGVAEAMEMPSKRFVVAVQWHPEDRIRCSEADLKLFETFAAAVKSRSNPILETERRAEGRHIISA